MTNIICVDFDMTLFDHQYQKIPESALEALDHIRDRYKIVLASGRNFNEVQNLPMKDLLRPDGIIHSNGSVIEADGRILRESFLEKDLLRSVLLFAIEHGLCLGTLFEGNYYNTNPSALKKRWLQRGTVPVPSIRDARELFGKNIHSLFLNDTTDAAVIIERNFPSLRAPIMSKDGGADVIPRHISKAKGMDLLLEYWHQTYEDVAAIGDSMNDYELLQAASIGIAMGNAIEELKQIADYITSSIADDGIKNAVIYLENLN